MGNPTDSWLIYALGGGMGHLTRALSLGRIASRRGHSVSILSNSLFAREILSLNKATDDSRLEGCRILTIDSNEDREGVTRAVTNLLEREQPSVFIVDTFPRGLGGELPAVWPCLKTSRKVLVQRFVTSEYLGRDEVVHQIAQYDLVLLPGEDAPLPNHIPIVRCAPFLIRNRDELFEFKHARSVLYCDSESDLPKPLVAVVGSGKLSEIDEAEIMAHRVAKDLAGKACVRLVATTNPRTATDPISIAHWPLMEAIRAVNVLVGAGGYNTVHEARATGTPLLAIPQKRQYDRQSQRLKPDERVATTAQMSEAVMSRVRSLPISPNREIPAFTNGAHQACHAIEEMG